MKMTLLLEISWNLAAREAIAGGSDEIQIEHLCMAILKLSETSIHELSKIVPETDIVQDMTKELEDLRGMLEVRNIDSMYVRRGLRLLVGNGGHTYSGGIIHRSNKCRELFEAATRLAESSNTSFIRTHHLLSVMFSSPSPDIARLLRNLPESSNASIPAKLPLLTQSAVNMCSNSLAYNDYGKPTPACRSLITALRATDPRGVFLVTANDALARDTVQEAANRIRCTHNPNREHRELIFDITNITSEKREESGQTLPTLSELFEEAKTKPNIMLFVPPMADDNKQSNPDNWALLRESSIKGRPVFICRISPKVYQQRFMNDRALRSRSNVIWVHQAAGKDIPVEL